CVEYSISPFTF
nr:immunoglobulin light chain junction region [Macaca mulatta]MOW09542.1 immunoglobulin light chain junction region [Macaca mulatta]MOW09785.1 immunoglobulin light chain junction region [Macaca mulatta]MOW09882.1 immunoglobulin light chain junction region [Macaca mulatta]MOW13641.1 immunoglobulin light chain junction region [Macaca mulatta]